MKVYKGFEIVRIDGDPPWGFPYSILKDGRSRGRPHFETFREAVKYIDRLERKMNITSKELKQASELVSRIKDWISVKSPRRVRILNNALQAFNELEKFRDVFTDHEVNSMCIKESGAINDLITLVQREPTLTLGEIMECVRFEGRPICDAKTVLDIEAIKKKLAEKEK